MACAVAASVLGPSGDFPAWLEAQGVNAEVAQAMDSELGIRDYGVLRACVGDGLVRAELLATARDRLPFGFYAVLRQVVKALQGVEPHDDGTTPHWDDTAVSSSGDMTLGGLVDVLLALFSGLSRELLLSVQRMGYIDNSRTCAVGSPSATGIVNPENTAMHEIDEYTMNDEDGENFISDTGCMNGVDGSSTIKMEALEGACGNEENSVFNMEDMVSANSHQDDTYSQLQQHQTQQRTGFGMQRNFKAEEMQDMSLGALYRSNPPKTRHFHRQQEAPNGVEDFTNEEADPSNNQLYRFSSMSSRAYEMNVTVNSKKKPYECTVCKKTFAWVSLLRYHQRIHTGEKPYRCKMCSRSFAQSCNLKVHERTHTGERPYRCKFCSQSFAGSGSLKAHVRVHTGERPYQCDICNSSFSRSHHLKAHQRTHRS